MDCIDDGVAKSRTRVSDFHSTHQMLIPGSCHQGTDLSQEHLILLSNAFLNINQPDFLSPSNNDSFIHLFSTIKSYLLLWQIQ